LHAVELLRKYGAKKIFGCFSHAVLSGNAAEKLEKSALEKIWVTDSVMFDASRLGEKFSIVPIAPLMEKFL
jgi:ribose-phosphate pyrophosphokinase